MTIQEKLYRQIATQLSIPVEVVERFCRYQFQFLKEQMEQPDNWQTVRLAKLASFKPMPDRLRRYQAKLENEDASAQPEDGAA